MESKLIRELARCLQVYLQQDNALIKYYPNAWRDYIPLSLDVLDVVIEHLDSDDETAIAAEKLLFIRKLYT